MTTTTHHPDTPGVSPLRRTLALTRAESLMVARDTAGLLVPIGLPLILLLVTGINSEVRNTTITRGYTPLDLMVLPSVMTMVVAFVALTNMPSFLTGYRRSGVLRSLAVTPIRPGTVLLAQILISIAQTILGLAVVLVSAFAFMGAHAPRDPLGVAGAYALGAAAMLAVGILIAAIAPTTNTAIAVGLVAFLGFGALGGMFGPTTEYPEALRVAGEYTPFGATSLNLREAWTGNPLEPVPMLVMVGITVVCGLLALRLYRWQ